MATASPLTPTATRSVKRTGAGAGQETVEQAAHAGRVAWQGYGKLLGMFGKCALLHARAVMVRLTDVALTVILVRTVLAAIYRLRAPLSCV